MKIKKLIILFISINLLSYDNEIKDLEVKDFEIMHKKVASKWAQNLNNITPKEKITVRQFIEKAKKQQQIFLDKLTEELSEQMYEQLPVDSREAAKQFTIAILQRQIELLEKNKTTDIINKNLTHFIKTFLNAALKKGNIKGVAEKWAKSLKKLTQNEKKQIIEYLHKSIEQRQKFLEVQGTESLSEELYEHLSPDTRELIKQFTILMLQRQIELLEKSQTTRIVNIDLTNFAQAFLDEIR